MRESVIGKRTFALFALLIASLVPGPGVSHEIPNDVRVQAYLKPEGQRLVLLVRVPMAALREVDVPLRGPAISTSRGPMTHCATAASLWLLTTSTSGRAMRSCRVRASPICGCHWRPTGPSLRTRLRSPI